MVSEARRNKHRIDVACGYAAFGFGSMTLHWLAILLFPPLAPLMLTMSGVSGLFGMVRSLRLPWRFKLVPAGALLYTALVIGLHIIDLDLWSFTAITVSAGLLCSAVCFATTLHLLRHEFGKPIPAWICGGCGYPLFGLTGSTCPECGRPFDPDKVPEAAKDARAGGVS